MKKKYRILYEINMRLKQGTVYRIQALEDFRCGDFIIETGDLGGWIAKEENLSQSGNCWVAKNAIVAGNAFVRENALITDNALLYGTPIIQGNAIIKHTSSVYDRAIISEYAEISGNARVYGNACVYGNAKVRGKARVFSGSEICDDAVVCGHAEICGHAKVCGTGNVFDRACICGGAVISNGKIFGKTEVCGTVIINDPVEFMCGSVDDKNYEDIVHVIYCSLKTYPVDGKYIFYKNVEKFSVGVYKDIEHEGLVFRDGEVTSATTPSLIHVTSFKRTSKNYSIIKVEVDLNDIMDCSKGKVWCKSVKVLHEIKQ